MGCGCGGAVAGDLWVYVDAGGNVSQPMPKTEAQAKATQAQGGYIRKA